MVQTEGGFAVAGVPERSVDWRRLAGAAYGKGTPAGMEPGLQETAFFDPNREAWGFGAHVALVRIDAETGALTLEKLVLVDDIGVVLNPMIVEAQVHGGLAQGLGEVLCEHMVFDENGQPRTGTLMDYAVPRASTMPPLVVGETETPNPFNPLGVKGVGEAGTNGAPPAVANAVMDALSPLGIDHVDMPYTAPKLWRAGYPGSAEGQRLKPPFDGMKRKDIVARRREFAISGYKTLTDVGFDGEWVTPIQKKSHNATGPVLVAHYWLDAPSVEPNRGVLEKLGYLPDIPFNRVLDRALDQVGLKRKDIYLTQTFHLLPDELWPPFPSKHIDESFDRITRHEVDGRTVIALGRVAADACRRAGIKAIDCISPSRPGKSHEYNAKELADALRSAFARIREREGSHVRAARYNRRREHVIVELSTGVEVRFPVVLAEGLAGASPEELADIEISPTGLGLHWPRLDADLYVPALLEGFFGSRSWMASHMGDVGGKSRSSAKAAAARPAAKLAEKVS